VKSILAVLYREYKIKATSKIWIFYDLCLPLGYLLIFGVGVGRITETHLTWHGVQLPYVSFFLAGVLAMTSFGGAMGAAWGLFSDRDNGIFYEFLTYPMRRGEFLLGKIFFNCIVAVGRALLCVAVAIVVLHVNIRSDLLPVLVLGVLIGTAGWFFFIMIFALRVRRTDIYYTLMDLFYFFLLFASSTFYPLDPMPLWLRRASLANPLTWHVDFLRYASLGVGGGATLAIEALAFCGFTALSFWKAARELTRKD
jgi:ABC-2 type transport system permease protein